MKFICLIYDEEARREAMSDDELKTLSEGCNDWTSELQRNGQLVACAGLQSSRTATTVRYRQGRMSVTDGPYAETKEQLGGFTIIEARDLNEALRIASHFPAARYGCVEVRPVFEPGAAFTTAFDRRIDAAMRGNPRAGTASETNR